MTASRPRPPLVEGESKADRKRRLGREAQARWRAAHPDGGAEASRRRRASNPGYRWPAKERNADEVTALKAKTPCLDCGENFPAVCMDFDHIEERGPKLNNVGTMVAHGWSRRKIMDEIAKCDIVCSNCHRIRTWGRHQERTTV